jgi:ATP-binding cassette subfamily B protein
MTDWREEDVLGKAYDARLMRRFLGYLRPHAFLVGAAFALVFLRIAMDLVGPLIVRGAVDGPIAKGDPGGLRVYAGLFVGSVAGLALLELVETLTTNLCGQRIIRDIRARLFRRLLRLPQAFFDRSPVGRLLTRVTNDVENLNELFTSGLVAFASDVFLLLGTVALMFVISWRLALVTMAITPVIAAAALLFRRTARERYRDMRKRIAALNAWLNESIDGIRTIQVFGRERACAERLGRLNGEYRESAIGVVFVYSLFFPGVELLSQAAVAALVWYGGFSIVAGSLTFGEFIAFWYCAQKFFQPVRDLSEKYNILQAAMASSERIFKLMDEPAEPEGGARAPDGDGAIAFEDVTFSYDGRARVLDGVRFRIEPGRTVAVVGLTGAGKTTLINLLLRFYDVGGGRVAVGGEDVRELDPRELRRRTALVLQDAHLFSGTVDENIRMGGAMARERVEAAARAVHAHGFIQRLPKGYDTPLGERGASLSSGERQLLSFARALAAEPRILILDEATSAVDSESEALIQEGLAALLKGRTSLVIAHRLSTIRRADRIVVLHHGRVAEEGTHDELVARSGLYAKLHRLQVETAESPEDAGPRRTQSPPR